MIEERYELAVERIRQIYQEESVNERFLPFFRETAEFLLMMDELKKQMEDGTYRKLGLEELEAWNRRLYEDILPENYGESFGNPDYAVDMLGEEFGSLLSALYTELRGAIPYVFEGKTEYLDILMELFLEIYCQFEEEAEPESAAVRDTIYWYASDYCDVFVADRIRDQIDPEHSFAADLICKSDLKDLRYLYWFGEYITENEKETAKFLLTLDEEKIQKMADVYTEGYRIGFVNTGKDLSRKGTVEIRYVIGFERVVKAAIKNFKAMGLKPVFCRSGASVLTRRQQLKTGYYGGIPNKQFDYDHKDDQALFFDKKFVERKLEVIQTTYEHEKELAALMAGPAVIEMFGEKPFSPDLLLVQLETLFNNKKLLKESFSHNPLAYQDMSVMSKEDEKFIEDINDIVLDHLDDEEFSINQLADKMHISRSKLHKKIKSITSYTPNDFIRFVRLKRAAELLESQNFRINEICYQVGFGSPSYFSKCFYRQYGVLPKDFNKAKLSSPSQSSEDSRVSDS